MFTEAIRDAISEAANRSGFEPAFILGFVQVESGGQAYWTVDGQQVPSIRPEGHYFYRNLQKKSPELLKHAIDAGLANPKAGAVRVPRTYAATYDMFNRMRAIDNESACRSISMGVGQVMGEWYARLGFPSALAMWQTCCIDLQQQVEIMLKFIATNSNLVVAIKASNYVKVASIYNGPNYKVNKYDTKLSSAVAFFRGKTDAPLPHQIDAVRIKKLGYSSPADFQAIHGLKPDGNIGPKTAETITAVEQGRVKPALNGINVGTVGSLGVGGLLSLANDRLDSVLPLIDKFKQLNELLAIPSYMLTAGIVVGAAVFMYYKLTHSDHAAVSRL